ncbi:MAG: DUF3656 domain-containing protein [Firmicutes bacterium]|nr:DUF3656 domain-containing protein [Bacillota bacterium]
MTELLAPAGSMEAFHAAIFNGADAVYMGGKDFGARAFAENFDDEAMEKAIRTAHFHGKKVYVTVNTLIADDEMGQALDYAARLHQWGVDGILIQDLGLLYHLRRAMPRLPLHASTQMSLHNAAGVAFAAARGMRRVVLARELSLDDIAAVQAASDIELEIFIHGALCVCYSGQCLFSSMVGGRSGNRGKCAQPCRMAYTLVDEKGAAQSSESQGKYLLSPKDLVGLPEIDALYRLGVASWKIEGRMKKPEYAAITAAVYSRYLRRLEEQGTAAVDGEDMRRLLQVFNRDHCSGYWHGNPGADLMSYRRPNNRGLFLGRISRAQDGYIRLKLEQPLSLGDGVDVWVSVGGCQGFTVSKIILGGQPAEHAQAGDVVDIPSRAGRPGDRVFKTFDAPLMAGAQASYGRPREKRLDFTIEAKKGWPLTVRAVDEDGFCAEAVSDYIVSAAQTSVSDWRSVQAQLQRLGGSGYAFGALDGEMDGDIMLPASVLNRCRREVVAQLLERHCQSGPPPAWDRQALEQAKAASAPARPHPAARPRLAVIVEDEETALAALGQGISDIYVDAVGFRGYRDWDYPALQQKLQPKGGRLIPYLPQIIAQSDLTKWQSRIAFWQSLSLPALVVNNPGQLVLAREAGWQGELYGGAALNVFNAAAAALLAEEGLRRLCLSPELALNQIQRLSDWPVEKELTVQGPSQLMVSEYCPLGALLGGRSRERACAGPCRKNNRLALKDEKGYVFPLRCDKECRAHIFNSRDLCLLPDMPKLIQAGVSVLTLDLRLYPVDKAKRIMGLYALALKGPGAAAEAAGKTGDLLPEGYTKGHLYRGV